MIIVFGYLCGWIYAGYSIIFQCYGAYSQKKHYVCKAVISTYELRDVIENVQKVDPKVLINTYNTVNFYGNFYQKPLE